MDEQVRDEVVKALRSAVRSLRSAESALLRAPASSSPPAPAPSAPPAEATLLKQLRAAAAKAKNYQEQDPQSFRVRYEPLKDELEKLVCSRQMLVLAGEGAKHAANTLEATDASRAFSQATKAMSVGRLQPADVLRPFVDQPTFKPWGDVDVTTDIVIFRFEHEGAVEVPLNEKKLQALVSKAREAPGAVERVQSVLAAAGIEWDGGNTLQAPVHVKWCATIDVRNIVDAVAARFIVVERTEASPEWWAAATAARDVPTAILPLIRGGGATKEQKVLCQSSLADGIETWAAALPGWYGTEDGANPLVLRNASKEDLALLR